MDYDKELLKAIESSNAALEEFKGNINERLDYLEKHEAKTRRPLIGGSGETNYEEKANLEAFGRYLRNGDKAEIKSLAVTTNSGADGGYAVPKVIDQLIESYALKQSPIRKYAQVVQITTQDYHRLVNKRGWGATWAAETDARPATTTAQLADVVPPMGELYANVQASSRMIDDVQFDVGNWLAQELGLAFGEAESLAFVSGSGTNQPLGILSAPMATTADSGRAYGTLQYLPTGVAGGWPASNPADILFNIIYSLKVAYRQGSVWLMSPALLQEISQFKDSYGRYLLQPAISNGTPPTLLGYEVVECEHFPGKAANSLSLAFGNLGRGYLIADRINTRIIVDPFSNKPYVGYYATRRTGGTVLNSEAIRVLKFSAT